MRPVGAISGLLQRYWGEEEREGDGGAGLQNANVDLPPLSPNQGERDTGEFY